MSSLFFLPFLVRIYKKSIDWKGLRYSIIPSLVIVFILYFIFSVHYYYTQKHLFDPFLQSPSPRFESQSTDKEETVFRILALGGSTTLNSRLPKHKQYPTVVKKVLQEYYPSAEIEVFNAGMDWYTTKHSLINYVTYYTDWKPDLVIVMHAINDLYRSFSPPSYAIGEYNPHWTHYYGPSIHGANPPTFEQHLFRKYLRLIIENWYFDARIKAIDYPLQKYVSIEAFEKNLKKIVNYVQRDKSNVLLVTQPSLYKETMKDEELRVLRFGKTFCRTPRGFLRAEYSSAKSLYRAMKAFNKITRKVASTEGAILVDAANHVNKNIKSFIDDVHYTERGAKSLAIVIAEIIIKTGAIEKKLRLNES